MTDHEIDDFRDENLQIQIAPVQEGMRIIFSGSMEIQNFNDPVYSYVENIHGNIVEEELKLVELDFTQLTFVNSSAIGALIRWFAKVPSLSKDKKYNIHLHYNPNIQWQKKGLKVLEKISGKQLTLISEVV